MVLETAVHALGVGLQQKGWLLSDSFIFSYPGVIKACLWVADVVSRVTAPKMSMPDS